eukprot:gnl/TRDRNA2_/TRDRNA2_145981_c0_seq1.p1 gnl/TRDRNA2_/TRDRNA2_145981_c0~~gnl/TRDRNA2_/TRDRNA2_145981_c0_seq1.p1  ORF type:complete len:486 (+),score=73.33 gnl/TRDRNA2_/TRDRNA2_145981_c0_seq1:65-1522(+)
MSGQVPDLSEPILGGEGARNVNANGRRFALLSALTGVGLLLVHMLPSSSTGGWGHITVRSPYTLMASMHPEVATKLFNGKTLPAANLRQPARPQVRNIVAAAYSPEQLAFLQRKEMETGKKFESSVATIGAHDAANFSPEQLAFLKRKELDYNAVRADLKKMMDDPDWDDGSWGPTLIRLGWHTSGTYSKYTDTGGSSGAAMRLMHGSEAQDPENAGLEHARAFLEPIKTKYPSMTYSDLWVLAAYVAIEHMGGPTIEFKPGRTDVRDDKRCPEWDGPAIDGKASSRLPHAEYGLVEGFDRSQVLDSQGRIKGWENLAQHIRDVFYRMGFGDREIVALMTGGHLWGRCHPEASGYAGPWVEEMTKWSNEYAADMIEDPWRMVTNDDTWLDEIGAEELRPAPGKRQYVNKFPPWEKPVDKDEPNQMMLVADMVLLWDQKFRPTLEEYAVDDTGTDDNFALRRDFAAAYKKLTELGTSNLRACPFAH